MLSSSSRGMSSSREDTAGVHLGSRESCCRWALKPEWGCGKKSSATAFTFAASPWCGYGPPPLMREALSMGERKSRGQGHTHTVHSQAPRGTESKLRKWHAQSMTFLLDPTCISYIKATWGACALHTDCATSFSLSKGPASQQLHSDGVIKAKVQFVSCSFQDRVNDGINIPARLCSAPRSHSSYLSYFFIFFFIEKNFINYRKFIMFFHLTLPLFKTNKKESSIHRENMTRSQAEVFPRHFWSVSLSRNQTIGTIYTQHDDSRGGSF